jgi:hypothetical protein
MINLLEQYGDEFKVGFDPCYDAAGVPREKLDLHLMRLTGKYGSVHPHSSELLAVETEGHPIVKGYLESLECTTTHLDGDCGFGSFLFKPEHLGEIAKIVRLYRRPKISAARRDELRRSMKSVRSQIQEKRETLDSPSHLEAPA